MKPDTRTKQAAETVNAGMDMTPELAADELITGTPTVVASSPGLTISNISVNAEQATIDGHSVAPGQGVHFRLAGGTPGTKYTLTVTCATDAGQVRTADAYLIVN